jgi:hypothetical protein
MPGEGTMRHPSKTSNVKERLQIAYSIADDLEYLHDLGIIHRRIHPKFVGFNSIDQLQHGLGDAIHRTRRQNKPSRTMEAEFCSNQRY